MKSLPLALVLLCLPAAVLLADTVQETYARGMRAYAGGDTETAREFFLEVIAQDPNHKGANASLRRIDATTPRTLGLKKQMESLVVPKVDFQDASLSTVLDYLPQVAKAQTDGKIAMNLVRMFPADFGNQSKVTLTLSNVPMASVLDYIAQMSGLKVTYEANAIVLRPLQ